MRSRWMQRLWSDAEATYRSMMAHSDDLYSLARLAGLKSIRGDARGAIADLQRALGCVDHAIDVPARACIDEWIRSVEEHVSHVHDVRTRKKDQAVAVGVAVRDMHDFNLLAIEVHRERLVKRDDRQSFSWPAC